MQARIARGVAAVAVAGAVMAGGPLHALPRAVAAKKPAYKIHLIAIVPEAGERLLVSRNGHYLANEAGDNVYKVSNGKFLGQLLRGAAIMTGITDQGVVWGYADRRGLTQSFYWSKHHLTWISPTDLGAQTYGCSHPANLSSEIGGVSASGIAVGTEFFQCPDAATASVAVEYDHGTFVPTGAFPATPPPPYAHPNFGRLITPDGYTEGGGDSAVDGSGAFIWSGVKGRPISLKKLTGSPDAQPDEVAREWNSHHHFIGEDLIKGDPLGQELWNGKRAVRIDRPKASSQEFAIWALSDTDMVVGSIHVNDSQVKAEVWTKAKGLQSLASLSRVPKGLRPLSAGAVDSHGDIFGSAFTKTKEALFEAVPR